MKKIVSLIGVAALALAAVSFTLPASAQIPTYYPQLIATSPATLATTVTTNFASPPVIDCSRQQNVALMFSFNQSGASTSNVVYTLAPSVDGVYYDTNNMITYTFPSVGTTRQYLTTNLNCKGMGYYEVYSIANATALTTMTNFGITYGLKMSAP